MYAKIIHERQKLIAGAVLEEQQGSRNGRYICSMTNNTDEMCIELGNAFDKIDAIHYGTFFINATVQATL
jgi:hypothetical protein